MSGFENKVKAAPVPERDEVDNPIPPAISWDEVQRRVAEAHYLRSVYFAEWMKRTARSWASVFRRPGRQIPTTQNKLHLQGR